MRSGNAFVLHFNMLLFLKHLIYETPHNYVPRYMYIVLVIKYNAVIQIRPVVSASVLPCFMRYIYY